MALRILVIWAAFKMNILAGYPAPLDVENIRGGLRASIAVENGTHQLLGLSAIDDSADHVTLPFKNFAPEAFSVMTCCKDTNCCIGNAAIGPFSTCTLTYGNLFIPT